MLDISQGNSKSSFVISNRANKLSEENNQHSPLDSWEISC